MTSTEIFAYEAEPKLVRARCPVCEAPSARPVATKDRFGFRVRYAICRTCQAMYLSEVLTRQGYERFYGGADGSPYRRLVWNLRYPDKPYDLAADQVEIMREQEAEATYFIPWLQEQGVELGRNLLDVGGSTGLVGRQVIANLDPTCELTVLDPSPSELAQVGFHGRTIRALAEDFTGGLYDFDSILCCGTVDHLTGPLHVLRQLRQALTANGWVFIDFSTHRFNKVDHTVIFNDRAFAVLIAKADFSVVDFYRTNRHHGALIRPI